MKIWHHIVAALVGVSAAGLIVFLVFGNASREGAVQEGAVPGSLQTSGETLCGSLTPAQGFTPAARKKALANLPRIVDPATKREVTVSANQPAQRAWFAGVHAAGGLCVDEIAVGEPAAPTTIELSTVDGMSEGHAAAFAGGAIAAANAQILARPRVVLTATIGDTTRTASVSRRAYLAFAARRRSMGLGTSIADLQTFHRSFPSLPMAFSGW